MEIIDKLRDDEPVLVSIAKVKCPMPYLVDTGTADSRSVRIEYDPPIDARRQVFIDGMRPRPADVSPVLPTRLRVGKPRVGGTPHILGMSLGPWIVSDRVWQILNELEPGVHTSSPMELVCEKSGEHMADYHLLLGTPQVDCVDIHRTDWWGGSVGHFAMSGKIVLKSASIKGRHLWKSVLPLRQIYFVSDEFRARLEWEKLDGWALRRKCLLTSET
jgi:hypothetical protein